MKEFKNLLQSIRNLSAWTQFISGSSASFSLAIICQIITGQAFIFCFLFALCPCLLSEAIIRKFYPTWIGQLVFWTARRKQDKDRQKSIRTILIMLLSVLVLSFIAFTVFCSIYAIPFLQKYTNGISPIWSVFLGIIAVLSTFISLFCFTFEEVYKESETIEQQELIELERIERERIEQLERDKKVELEQIQAFQAIKERKRKEERERIEREQQRQTQIKATVSLPTKATSTTRTKSVQSPKKQVSRTGSTNSDNIAKLKDRTKKQFKRKFDLSTSEKSRQSNSDKFDISRQECIEAGLSVTTNDEKQTILITKK